MSQKILPYEWVGADTFTKGRGGASIRSIVIHSSCGHRAGDVATLTGHGGRQVSSHWYVTKDLKIYHFVDDADTAWHAGVVDSSDHDNRHTIGIEQEHMDGQEAWPADQVKLTAQLVAALRQKHGRDLPYVSHVAVARPVGRKTDPVAYPWGDFGEYLAEAGQTQWTLVRATSAR